ncbi:hypothetical protein M514_27475 [Trichuris suis]|uniref:Uncharacterized protein n=1 Tax=Trichuris suis TaxID=68888 RepID=A0A085MSZ9_9BILA|nr:hypothetical protein M514_27475 [Trichuris suis]
MELSECTVCLEDANTVWRSQYQSVDARRNSVAHRRPSLRSTVGMLPALEDGVLSLIADERLFLNFFVI